MRRPVAVTLTFGLLAAGTITAIWLTTGRDAWPRAAGANVMLVTLDTLRADRLTDVHMPRLAALARQGHRFPTSYAHAPLTLPSHASMTVSPCSDASTRMALPSLNEGPRRLRVST